LMLYRSLALGVAALALAACTTVRTTGPTKSAQQELLVSTAADRAAEALAAQIPPNLSAYVDPMGVPAEDEPYALAAVTDALLRHGTRLAPDAAHADAVIVPRAGALSTDERNTLLGIPSLPIPTPAGTSTPYVTPAISLYQQSVAKGVAKFAATVFDPHSGKLIVSTDPAYGFSEQRDGVVLFVFTWSRNDMGIDLSKSPPEVKKAP